MIAEPISVLFFTNATARGGAEEHMLTLLRGLDRTRFRSHLVCPPEIAEKLKADLPPDVELIPLCLRSPWQLDSAYRFAQILRQRRVQIVHSHRFYSSLFASPIAAMCRVPVVVETPHLSERWRRGWFTRYFVADRLVGRFVDCYIGVSEANARYLAEEKGLPQRKIVIIRNGCDITRFDPDHRAPKGLKASLGFSDTNTVIVLAARLEAQKGHGVLLRALPAVLREFPEARLVCLGDGALRGELRSQARVLGIQNAVRFLGHRSDMADWLALADFTVLPSLWEGLPLTAIESLAAGRAVVATAVDGTPEVVLEGKTGLTVPPDDSERLASAMCRLLQDPELCRKMGRIGRDFVVMNFTQERQIRETQQLYLQLWKRRRGAQPVVSASESRESRPSPLPAAKHNQ